MSIRVFGVAESACTQKVLLTLAEKDVSYELCRVDLLTGEHKQPSHLARHPFGVVPAIDHDGFELYESTAIMRYLDARFPDPPLTPSSLQQRARMDQMISVEQSYLSRHTNTLIVQLLLAPTRGATPDATAVGQAREGLATCATVLNDVLAQTRFLAADERSLADLACLPYVAAAMRLEALPPIERSPHLARWLGELTESKSWRALTPRG